MSKKVVTTKTTIPPPANIKAEPKDPSAPPTAPPSEPKTLVKLENVAPSCGAKTGIQLITARKTNCSESGASGVLIKQEPQDAARSSCARVKTELPDNKDKGKSPNLDIQSQLMSFPLTRESSSFVELGKKSSTLDHKTHSTKFLGYSNRVLIIKYFLEFLSTNCSRCRVETIIYPPQICQKYFHKKLGCNTVFHANVTWQVYKIYLCNNLDHFMLSVTTQPQIMI